MKLEIKEKKENQLLSRTEVTAYLTFEGATPTLPEMKKELAKASGSQPDLIDIVKAETHFGESKATLTANVYPSIEVKKDVVGKLPKKQAEKVAKEEEARKKAEEEKKAAEEAAKAEAAKAKEAEAAAETPAEENKEGEQ